MPNRPIGVFDSGMGGLTVLSELLKQIPGESYLYIGDTARVPYGARSKRTVQRYSEEVADYLMKKNIKMLVIACNTATAHAEELLKTNLPIPVIGVIKPGVAALLKRTEKKKVGVIGTRSTIKSKAYEDEIYRQCPEIITVVSKACPLFVPLVEEGWVDKQITALTIREYLTELSDSDVDAIVLGCTHYPLLKGAIQREFPNISLVDSSVEVASAVHLELGNLGLRNQTGNATSVRILLTDITDQMKSLETLFFGMPFQDIEEVELADKS